MREHDRTEKPRRASRSKWVLAGFLLVAAYFLWAGHQAHLMGALPYLLLLACPLMHLFHHGHGGHGHRHGQPAHSAPHETSRNRGKAGEESRPTHPPVTQQ